MNLLKSFKVIICVVVLATVLTGCMNRVNLKDLMVIEGMGIDNVDDKTQLTIQSLNVGMSTSTEKPQGNITINTTEQGDTIVDAISNLSKAVSKELFFGQNKIILFSREVCETDFKAKIDYFLRSSDSRDDVAICMVDGDAKQILENSENDTHVPVENLVHLINNGQNTGNSFYLTTEDLLNASSDKTTDIHLPVVKERSDNDNAELSGIAIFNNDKLAYILDDDETLGFMLITGKVKNCFIEFENEKLGKVGVEITSPKAVKKVQIINGSVNFDVNLKGNLMINEVEKGVANSLTKQDDEDILEQAESELTNLCKKAFEACQKYNSDSLRVGEYLAKDCPKSYEILSDDWDYYFKTVTFSSSADLKLKKISDNTHLD
jgi:spore germination protein KC